ncbi:hypothetical protein ACHAQA_006624 [Verticillium albo-atrum]
MKTTTTASIAVAALLAGPGVLATAVAGACNHNNCLRAVIASAFTTRNGKADCSTYLRVTVTPATTTFTETVTPTVTAEAVTVTTTVEARSVFVPRDGHAIDAAANQARELHAEKRQAQAGGTTFPAYASACTSFAKYSSACSCVGVSPETTTAATPSTTVTETEYTTLVPTETATVINIARNGGFETKKLSPWTITKGQRYVSGSITDGGKASNYQLLSKQLNNNDLFEVWQTLYGEAGTTYQCSYDWKFSHYYETEYNNGYVYVPYIHGYVNNDITTNDRPSPDTLDVWQTTTFTFTSTGEDIWWFDCASPQARGNKAGQGPNFVSLDNFVCVAA